jgi:uncharacterized membrane protein HdeD (DUF308 family)
MNSETASHAGAEETIFPWWLVLVEGIIAALAGLLLLIAPAGGLVVLVEVFGFYLLIGGVFRIASIFVDASSWGWKLLGGILGIVAGIVVVDHPLWSAIMADIFAVYPLAFLAMLFGLIGFVHAFQGGGWGAGILGILSIVFGLIVVLNPLIGLVALPFVLGAFMLVGGIAAIVMSFRLRGSSPTATAA